MKAPSYLKQCRQGWHVQLAVPRSRQLALGCRVLTQSLQTRDQAEAMRRRHKVIAELQAKIADAPEVPQAGTPEALLASAIEARGEVDAGTATAIDAAASLDYTLDRFLRTEAKVRGIDKDGHPLLPADALSTIRRAHKAMAGTLRNSLEAQREAYLKETSKRLTAQTMADKRRRLEAFGDWLGDDRDCSELDRKKAGQYVSG